MLGYIGKKAENEKVPLGSKQVVDMLLPWTRGACKTSHRWDPDSNEKPELECIHKGYLGVKQGFYTVYGC